MDIIRQDLKDMDTTWDEAEELAADRAEWRQRVAQCIHQVELSSKEGLAYPVSSTVLISNHYQSLYQLVALVQLCLLLANGIVLKQE